MGTLRKEPLRETHWRCRPGNDPDPPYQKTKENVNDIASGSGTIFSLVGYPGFPNPSKTWLATTAALQWTSPQKADLAALGTEDWLRAGLRNRAPVPKANHTLLTPMEWPANGPRPLPKIDTHRQTTPKRRHWAQPPGQASHWPTPPYSLTLSPDRGNSTARPLQLKAKLEVQRTTPEWIPQKRSMRLTSLHSPSPIESFALCATQGSCSRRSAPHYRVVADMPH